MAKTNPLYELPRCCPFCLSFRLYRDQAGGILYCEDCPFYVTDESILKGRDWQKTFGTNP